MYSRKRGNCSTSFHPDKGLVVCLGCWVRGGGVGGGFGGEILLKALKIASEKSNGGEKKRST